VHYTLAFSGNIYSTTIVNSTVSQNQAGGYGGGIFMQGTTQGEILNSTFAGNNAANGREVMLSGNTFLDLYNTIFACAPPDNGNCYLMLGNSVINNNHSLVGVGAVADFGLDQLADNGGPTQTMALLPGSSLIDAGDDVTCANSLVNNLDQRGVARPQNDHCEIGVYEYQPVIHYVKWDASGANNGVSWTDAYTDLQSALSAASSGEEIWVAAGTYKPTTTIDRTATFALKDDVRIYGGFAGTESARIHRDASVNITILSGDIGILGDNNDNSYHVVVGSNTNNSAMLDGFTVTAGNANSSLFSSDQSKGGGMYNDSGSPTVMNVIFSSNYGTFGGGMYNGGEFSFPNGSNPILTNLTFSNNSAIEGGGMRNEDYSSPTLTNVIFNGNSVIRAGGGMQNFHYSSPILTNATFNGNTGSVGAGMMNTRNDEHVE
ncbi:MAG: hypothetical protein L0287_05200, partial [Anaerolineae bacterium]|nr:hypothetical protein [Anaerolineae bacterium]